MITKENAERLKKISDEMNLLLEEFKSIYRAAVSPSKYQQFKYRTLGHLEPGLLADSEWYTKYSSIDPLESVADGMIDECEDFEDANADENALDEADELACDNTK